MPTPCVLTLEGVDIPVWGAEFAPMLVGPPGPAGNAQLVPVAQPISGHSVAAVDASGQLVPADCTNAALMPVGIGADTASIQATEALAAGDFVNVWNSGGPRVRKADATVAGKEAHGFVLAAVGNGANATVYFEGSNTQVTGQTAGPVYLLTTAGKGGATPPSSAGNVVQLVGFATGTTNINFQAGTPVTLA